MINTTDGNTLFYSTGDSTHKPFLDLEYFNPASISENKSKKDYVLFPNPSSDDFISVRNLTDFEGQVTAIDVTGRQYPISYSRSLLDISRLAAGTYFIVFKNKEYSQTKRFVKI